MLLVSIIAGSQPSLHHKAQGSFYEAFQPSPLHELQAANLPRLCNHSDSCNQCQLLYRLQAAVRVHEFADKLIHLRNALLRCLWHLLTKLNAWYVPAH